MEQRSGIRHNTIGQSGFVDVTLGESTIQKQHNNSACDGIAYSWVAPFGIHISVTLRSR